MDPVAYADDGLYRSPSPARPKPGPVVAGGGSRHVAPVVEEEEVEPPVEEPVEAPAPPAAGAPTGALETAAEPEGPEGAEGLDFWTREAHGLEPVAAGSFAGPPAVAAAPHKRRRRRRKKGPAAAGGEAPAAPGEP